MYITFSVTNHLYLVDELIIWIIKEVYDFITFSSSKQLNMNQLFEKYFEF